MAPQRVCQLFREFMHKFLITSDILMLMAVTKWQALYTSMSVSVTDNIPHSFQI